MSKKGLGRGLSALIPDKEEKGKENIQSIPIDKIKPNPDQPRENFNKESLMELADSIKEHGIIQPLIGRKIEDTYYIIAGERRLRAAELAGLKEVPMIIRDIDDEKNTHLAIIENIQREDLSPIEEGKAYSRLIDTFHLTQEEVSKRLGKSRTYITNILRLSTLPLEVQKLIEEGELSGSHGRAILGIPKEYQTMMAFFSVKNGLSVRELEALAKDFDPGVLEGNERTTKKTVAKPKKDVHIQEVEKKLEEIYGTKALIKGKNKGKIILEYYSQDELIRLIDQLYR